jgi:hypothetical protein
VWPCKHLTHALLLLLRLLLLLLLVLVLLLLLRLLLLHNRTHSAPHRPMFDAKPKLKPRLSLSCSWLVSTQQ